MNGPPKRHRSDRRRLRLLAVALLLLWLVSGVANARTTVTPLARPHLAVSTATPSPSVPNVKVLSSGLVRVTATTPGATTRAGTQTAGTLGLAGSTTTLPACGSSPCTDPYRGAGAGRLRVNDFAAVLHLQVTQPGTPGGVATGFAVELAVHIASGWFVFRGYFSTGTNPTTSSTTINLDVYVDLGVRTLPTLLATDIALDGCQAAARCP
jgi:hypothetical protein